MKEQKLVRISSLVVEFPVLGRVAFNIQGSLLEIVDILLRLSLNWQDGSRIFKKGKVIVRLAHYMLWCGNLTKFSFEVFSCFTAPLLNFLSIATILVSSLFLLVWLKNHLE